VDSNPIFDLCAHISFFCLFVFFLLCFNVNQFNMFQNKISAYMFNILYNSNENEYFSNKVNGSTINMYMIYTLYMIHMIYIFVSLLLNF